MTNKSWTQAHGTRPLTVATPFFHGVSWGNYERFELNLNLHHTLMVYQFDGDNLWLWINDVAARTVEVVDRCKWKCTDKQTSNEIAFENYWCRIVNVDGISAEPFPHPFLRIFTLHESGSYVKLNRNDDGDVIQLRHACGCLKIHKTDFLELFFLIFSNLAFDSIGNFIGTDSRARTFYDHAVILPVYQFNDSPKGCKNR